MRPSDQEFLGQELHTLMADNLHTLIRHLLMKSIYVVLVLHTLSKQSSTVHTQQRLATSTKKHQELGVAHIDFLLKLSCHRQLTETLEVLVHFLGL